MSEQGHEKKQAERGPLGGRTITMGQVMRALDGAREALEEIDGDPSPAGITDDWYRVEVGKALLDVAVVGLAEMPVPAEAMTQERANDIARRHVVAGQQHVMVLGETIPLRQEQDPLGWAAI